MRSPCSVRPFPPHRLFLGEQSPITVVPGPCGRSPLPLTQDGRARPDLAPAPCASRPSELGQPVGPQQVAEDAVLAASFSPPPGGRVFCSPSFPSDPQSPSALHSPRKGLVVAGSPLWGSGPFGAHSCGTLLGGHPVLTPPTLAGTVPRHPAGSPSGVPERAASGRG